MCSVDHANTVILIVIGCAMLLGCHVSSSLSLVYL